MYYTEKQGVISTIERIPILERASINNGFSTESYSDDLLIELVIQHYSKTLLNHEQALGYLRKRGFDNPELLSRYRIGFSGRSLGIKLQALPKDEQAFIRGGLQRLGLLKPSGHEFFRGSLIFPFINEDNQIMGGYGRRTTPKLKSGSVYHLHWYTEQISLFNQGVLSEFNKVILCKNPINALSWIQCGFKHAVAVMGAYQAVPVDLFLNNEIETVYLEMSLFLENRKGVSELCRSLSKRGVSTYLLNSPDGMDSNECLQYYSHPARALHALLNTAVKVNFCE